jgi:hypothetical protein
MMLAPFFFAPFTVELTIQQLTAESEVFGWSLRRLGSREEQLPQFITDQYKHEAQASEFRSLVPARTHSLALRAYKYGGALSVRTGKAGGVTNRN